MRGALHTLYRAAFRYILASTVLLVSVITTIAPAQADAGILELARDTVWSFVPDAAEVTHEIYFVLPLDAEQVRPGDYIFIKFPYYQNVTTPTELQGAYGEPQYTLLDSNRTLRITGIVLLPGTGITLAGITATNPGSGFSSEVVVQITSDAAGTVVRNQATLIPTDSRSTVSVSALIQSPLAALNVSGSTSPSAFVTFTENSSVLATTVSSPTGFFNFTLTAVDPGAHTYRIFATDTSERATAQTALNLFLLGGNLTTATNIILSSSLALDQAEIDPGDALTISGASRPNSQINIFLESPLRSYTTSSDPTTGEWSYTVPASETSSLSPGQYRVYTVVQDSESGNQSITSSTLTFQVKAPDTNNPAPACDISQGDLNCNGVTNLVDFSILLFHWNTNHRVADINGDGTVNLVDFSIMMFYYTS